MTARTLSLLLAAAAAMLVLAVGAGATTPGPNGRIAFSSTRDGSSSNELYSAAADGSDAKRLTWSAAVEQSPAWSPDGTRIAYESNVSGRSRIYVMNADGSGQTQITPPSALTLDDRQPTWSPDGSRLAFTSSRPTNGSLAIWIVNVDGTGLHQLTSDFSTDPSWSPDGTRVAYVGADSVYTIGADGTGALRVTLPPAGFTDQAPDWSPDGGAIVFARSDFATTMSDLYAVAPDGSGLRQLTAGTRNFAPSWSPDGTKIGFSRLEPTGTYDLVEMNANGSGITQVTTNNDYGPAWGTSPVSPNPMPPTAPVVQIVAPADGMGYEPGQQVSAFYLCSSYVSFVIACDGTVPVGAPVDTSTGGTKTFTVTATDLDGRQTVSVVTYTVVDFTAPQIAVRSPASGASYTLGQPVAVDYSCTDEAAGSGIASCVAPVPQGGLLDTSHAGSFAFVVNAADRAGNHATASVPYTVTDPTPPPDRTAPTVSIAAPADGAVYPLGASAAASYTCADEAGGSGIASCTGTPLDTDSVGIKVFTATATDKAGNTTTATRSYWVLYVFTGFLKPIAAYPAPNWAGAGDDVQVKFSLHGNQGLGVVTSSSWWSCTSGPSADLKSSLSYKAHDDLYTFRATSSRSFRGTCRDLVIALNDGTVKKARFMFRK